MIFNDIRACFITLEEVVCLLKTLKLLELLTDWHLREADRLR